MVTEKEREFLRKLIWSKYTIGNDYRLKLSEDGKDLITILEEVGASIGMSRNDATQTYLALCSKRCLKWRVVPDIDYFEEELIIHWRDHEEPNV